MNRHYKGNPKAKMLIKQTFYKTKNFFHNTFKDLKLLVVGGYEKLPKPPLANPLYSGSKNIDHEMQELDNFYRGFSEKWGSDKKKIKKKKKKKKKDLPSPKEQRNGEEECDSSSMSVIDQNQLQVTKEEKKAAKSSEKKQVECGYQTADALAQKMKELEMMDVNDVDHVLDVEEVLHYYSQLTCPAYVQIVDTFFMDMYKEFNVPQQPSGTINASMRKVEPVSVHSSMRSLGPIKV